jgi:thiamine biosynthesis lipoprotein
VAVSEDFYPLLQASRAIARASDGAFDVTAGPLTVLWRSARRHADVPGDDQIAAALAKVGDAKIVLDEAQRTVLLRVPGMQLDFGGIAKGFAADEAAAVLSRRGIGRALVAAGGDIVATDAPPGQEGWHVAVAGLGTDEAGSIGLRHQAVSTSGDAEQFLEVKGTRYSHILDPRTGHALTGRSSVTVVARDGTTSDSLATAVSVLGPDAGMRLVDRTPGAAARMIRDDGSGRRVYASARWVER